MSKHLAHLLATEEAVVADIISHFESLSGFDSHDVRLVSEMKHQARSKIAELGLDPDDTKAKELYHGLASRLASDIYHFEAALGLKAGGPDDDFGRLKNLIELSGVPGEVWALKSSSARKLLIELPPKKLMRHLGYRSIQSMLKRENVDIIYLGTQALEPSSYLKKLERSYAALSSNNFESRTIRVVSMQRSCWKKLSGPDQSPVSSSSLRGVIAVWPTANQPVKSLVVQLWQVLAAIEHLRLSSLMFKLHQAGGEFNKDIVRLLRQHYSLEPQQLAELLGPHLHADELRHFEPVEVLAKLSPSFGWWTNNHHLAATYKSGSISFNANDVLKNLIHNVPYEQRSSAHFRASLWDKLLSRYLSESAVEEFILSHLDTKRWQYEALPIRENQKEVSVLQPTAGIFE